MDIQTLAAAIGVAKKLPDTAAGRAESAASRAESAAELAQNYGYSLTFEEGYMVVGEETPEVEETTEEVEGE